MPDTAQVIDKARTPAAFTQAAVLGVRQTGGWIMQDPLVQLQARRGIREFMEMSLNDATIGGVLFAIEQVVRQVEWDVLGMGDEDPVDRKAKDFLRSNMDDMSLSWDDFITDSLSFLPYGWSLSEEVYKLRLGKTTNKKTNSKFSDGMIGWQRFQHIHQSTWGRWNFSEKTNELMSFTQQHPNTFQILDPIPMDKLIHFRTKHCGGNPEGQSIMRNAWRSWRFKKLFEEIEGIGIERDLAGLPSLTPPAGFDWEDPQNANIVAWAREFITHVRRDEYEGILLPSPEWVFELVTTGGRRQFDTTAIVNRYDKRVVMSMLAQFLMLGMERIGSFALVKSLSDLWLTAIDGYVKGMVSVINRGPVRHLFELNPEFDGIDLPKIAASKINVPDLADFSKMIEVVSAEDGGATGFGAGGEASGAGGGGEPIVDLRDPEIQNEILRIMRMPLSVRERRESGSRAKPAPKSKPKTNPKQKLNGKDLDV